MEFYRNSPENIKGDWCNGDLLILNWLIHIYPHLHWQVRWVEWVSLSRMLFNSMWSVRVFTFKHECSDIIYKLVEGAVILLVLGCFHAVFDQESDEWCLYI